MKKQELSLQVINEYAAGINIGSRFHMVVIDQLKENVRQFGVYSKDHQQLIDYLHNAGVTSIAMESTGNYWQTLFSELHQAGFKVLLVSGSQTKNVKRSQNRCYRLHVDTEIAFTWSVIRKFSP